MNPALKEMFGYGAGDLTGTSRRLLTEENERRMRQELADHGAWTAEVETERADGTLFWCSVKASNFEDPEHGMMRVALYHDVTERREADARRRQAEKRSAAALVELERSNAELEQFAHVASHDLSEPLRVVGGFVGLLQKRYQGELDDDADRFIDATVSGVERMQALIDALLAYSRVGSGDLQVEAVDTGRVAAEAVRVQERRIQEAEGEVVIGDLPTVSGDAVLLERVFQNLVSNAIKFKADGVAPRVTIDAERSDFGVWHFKVAGQRDGHPARARRAGLRHVPAAPGAPDGGHRNRAVHHEAHNREARWPHLGRAGRRRGDDIQLHPAPGALMNPAHPSSFRSCWSRTTPKRCSAGDAQGRQGGQPGARGRGRRARAALRPPGGRVRLRPGRT